MARLRRLTTVAIKHETVPGAAESLTSSDVVPNTSDAQINPQITADERPGGGPTLSPLVTHMGARGGTCTFTVELTGESAPKWASLLLPILGFGASGAVYTPSSIPPGASGSPLKTATVGVYIDGKLKQLRGAMGTGTFRFESVSARMFLDVELTGIWVTPSNVTTPTYLHANPLRFADAAVTIGTFVPRFSQMSIELNNEVALREDATDISGYRCAIITGRNYGGSIDPEATLTGAQSATVWDPHADQLAMTTRALEITVGELSFTAPALQVIDAPGGDRNNIDIDQIQYRLVRSTGDDELKITVPAGVGGG